MKQRLSALLLALMLVLALAACGPKDAGNGSGPSAGVSQSPAPESTQPAQTGTPEPDMPDHTPDPGPAQTPSGALPSQPPAVTPAPQPPESTQPSPAPRPSASPSPAPSPSVTPAPAPSETPEASGSVDLTALYDSLASEETFAATMELTAGLLEGYYPGLAAISTNQRVIYMPMMSSVVCEIALVEVADPADVDAVKAIFQARIDAQVGTDDSPGGAWYPESIEAWRSSSRIVSNGSYVMLVAWAQCDDAVAAFDALFA